MPTRFIKESCRSSKNLDKLSDFEERLFWRLITTADDFGRFMACPELVRSACFPYKTLSTDRINSSLHSLQTHDLIRLYVVDDRQYGEFIKWEKHQGKPRAKDSKYPACIASASICMQPLAHVTGHSDTDTEANTDSSLSSLQSESEEGKECEKGEGATDFEIFWKAYPKRVGGKKNALRAWERAQDRPALAEILAVLERSKQTEQWKKDGGQFIPYPATWLNRGMWADDLKPMESAFKRSMNSFLDRHKEDEA